MAIVPSNEDPEHKSAQLAKLHAETAKLGAEKQKLDAETKAASRIANGSYWSEAVKILGAVVLGLGGFVTAAGSYFVARNQVELAELKASNANEKLKSAESAAAAAKDAEAKANARRDEARKEEAAALKNAEELRAVLAKQTAQVQAAKPELLERRLVYIQFQGSLNRSLINELRTSLEAKGYSTPGAERREDDYRNQVKFFREEDAEAATALARSTEQFFASKNCPIQISPMKAKSASTSPPLELWIAHSCKA